MAPTSAHFKEDTFLSPAPNELLTILKAVLKNLYPLNLPSCWIWHTPASLNAYEKASNTMSVSTNHIFLHFFHPHPLFKKRRRSFALLLFNEKKRKLILFLAAGLKFKIARNRRSLIPKKLDGFSKNKRCRRCFNQRYMMSKRICTSVNMTW